MTEQEEERKRCFFDVAINGVDSGRIIIELFNDVTPKTCENFRKLCTGEAGDGSQGKQLYYKGIIFHRVIKNFMIQSGDFINSNGSGGESIYGRTFDDENFTLKHEKPFLLSMANRGKNTNSSQFFITTSPAPHLDGIHTVFGRVVSGIDVVKVIEDLPVDRNSRPMDEATVKSCGELVKQVKTKTDKKKKKVESSASASSSSSESPDEEKSKKKKKKKDKKKSSKKSKKKEAESSVEEGELESDTEGLNPLVASLTKIDPSEIPEVTNRFLMRSEKPRDEKAESSDKNGSKKEIERDHRERRFGWSKKNVPQSRSGRVIKGRGNFRYRTPSRSKSRSGTPEHWKAASRRLIKITDFEKLEEQKKERGEEIRRRMEERKRRHEAVSKGDGKKPFYEISHDITVAKVAVSEKNDPNALDYEVDEDELKNKRNQSVGKDDRVKLARKSRSISRNSRDDKRFDRRDFQRRDFKGRNYDNRNVFGRNRYDNSRRSRSRDRFRRQRSRSKSMERNLNRRSRERDANSRKNRNSSRSPIKPPKTDQKSPEKKSVNEIEDLEQKVMRAKKVLELIVKEKEIELSKRKRSPSLSNSERSAGRKRKDKKRKRSSSSSSSSD